MSSIEVRDYPGKVIPRGDALAILGKTHPAYDAVNAMPCAGNHKIGYCTGVVVDKAAVLALLDPDANVWKMLDQREEATSER